MINIDISKYEESVIKNLDKDNVDKILSFLSLNRRITWKLFGYFCIWI